MIPVTVIVTTKDEEKNIARCLGALKDFDEIIVVDSESADGTREAVERMGVTVIPFRWNGLYPKKRQWCLDNLALKHDRVFFVDADEVVTPELAREIASLDWRCAGYFVRGAYVVDSRVLRFGIQNNKLCLFDRRKIEFPVVDDLDIPGMGEIEGHYQPVLKKGFETEKIGRLKNNVLHYAVEDRERYRQRHENYIVWKRGMKEKLTLPSDPVFWRRGAKTVFGYLPFRGIAYGVYFYIWKLGIFEMNHNREIFRETLKYYRS
jgi:glycosyltransferase involved in cell wall biosynthesis